MGTNCYNQMFAECDSLSAASELPATTLATSCYYRMFYGCLHLHSLTAGFTSWDANATLEWLNSAGGTSGGTFTGPSSLPE